MACRKDFVRQFPGRIVGQTEDIDGKTGFVLTLSTREQHIRRERATSNICTNQAWCALRATIFLEILGKEGLRELALQNVQKANYLKDNLARIKGVTPKFGGEIFNEFVVGFDKPWKEIEKILMEKRVVGGLPLENIYPELADCVLLCVTEWHRKEEMDRLLDVLQEVCR
jgi:glycine dehydrogenase subunit 1